MYKQPENDDEIEQCEDAAAQCPVQSIGNDG
ncbi:MAG: 4Fe-4S domain-containing protein [Planctomycetota bacterium]